VLASVAPQTSKSGAEQCPKATLWNVPFDENPFFTGREAVLENVRTALNSCGRAAICGLGGIGKTQTVVKYAYRFRQSYHAVFWVSADSDTSLTSGYVELARLLNLPQADEPDQSRTIEAVTGWLEHNDGWLLVLDNADKPDLVKPFRPLNSKAHILVTSRNHRLQALGIASPVDLGAMSREESVDFLCSRTSRARDDKAELRSMEELAGELGYLPLALEQAGPMSPSTTHGSGLSEGIPPKEVGCSASPVAGEYPESVATTWAINFSEVEQRPESADLLRLSASWGRIVSRLSLSSSPPADSGRLLLQH